MPRPAASKHTSVVNTAFEELSPAERLRLVQEMWDRIAANPGDVPVTPSMAAELDRRLEAHHRAPEDVVSWDEVKSGTRRKKK